jgi:hypothetical protein
MMVILFAAMVMNLLGACGTGREVIPVKDVDEWLKKAEWLPGRRDASCGTGAVKDASEIDFDPNGYFKAFDRLTIEPGYTLDFVYLNDGGGAKPVVYAHSIEEEPLNGYRDYLETRNIKHPGSFAAIKGSDDYLRHVQIEDTPEGYIQFAALSIIDDQFCLYWHALYNDTRIITSAEQAGNVFKRFAKNTEGITHKWYLRNLERVVEGIPELDYTPTVEMRAKKAIVHMIVFSEWGGFSELRFVINREFPHKTRLSSKTRLYFDSGVTF